MNILLLAGGESGEREVSLSSAKAIVAGLRRLQHTVAVIDDFDNSTLLDEAREYDSYDVAFLALHGGSGEDGTVQAGLDKKRIRYTGSG